MIVLEGGGGEDDPLAVEVEELKEQQKGLSAYKDDAGKLPDPDPLLKVKAMKFGILIPGMLQDSYEEVRIPERNLRVVE